MFWVYLTNSWPTRERDVTINVTLSSRIAVQLHQHRTAGKLADATRSKFPEQTSEVGSDTISKRGWIPYWSAKRHLTCGNPSPHSAYSSKLFPWRGSAPAKLKTANAALVLCLNIDVDPPDVIKTSPCAVLECWVDPHTLPSHKALEAIGTNLQHQFEGLSLKIPYKPILDPSYEDLRRFCMTLRKQAKDDTVCFYYNGHGVPKPTPSGELWCFNRTYTQYIPVSLMEVQSWLGSPGVYIWDCSAAGNLLANFNTFADRRDQEVFNTRGGYPDGMQPYMHSLQLAACLAHEQLPSCPELPADIFTSCLTSPIDIALRYFIMTHYLPNNITPDMVMQLPGDLKDRRTPLGELNWIFTAITDTIAWTTFPRDLFTRLYRSDLLIASLFRNFLLAERIMKNYHCTPHTYPSLPPTNTHPLWSAWDLAVDTCLRQLPDLLSKAPSAGNATPSLGPAVARTGRIGQQVSRGGTTGPQGEKPYQYVPSRFFADQLTAFEVWISRGGSALTKRGPLSLPVQNGGPEDSLVASGHAGGKGLNTQHSDDLVPRKPPDQLPIVLQVLLSQPHRLRALILLSQFVDLGPWAVNLVLTIGIFPYISKLLQAAGQDLRPVLIFIWARIMAVDPSVQVDLHNTGGFKYFANVLGLTDDQPQHALPNSSEHKAMCAFILATVARDFYHGQTACWRERVFDSCFEKLKEADFLLRQWSALCIAQIWEGNDEIKVYGVDRGTQDKLIPLLSDASPEVRAAAMYALGTFMGASGSADPAKQGGGGSGTQYQLEERLHFRMEVAVVTGATVVAKEDASPMVRKELLVLISCLVKEWRGYFVVCAWIYWEEDRKWRTEMSPQPHEEEVTSQAMSEWLDSVADDDAAREENRVLLSSFFTIFVALLELTVDPYHEVATNAQTITDYVMALLLASPFYRLDCTTLDSSPTPPNYRGSAAGPHSRVPSLQSSPLIGRPPTPVTSRPSLKRADTVTSTFSGVTSTLRRTSSFASVLRSFTGGISFPSVEEGRAPSSPLPGFSTPSHLDAAQSRPPSPNFNLAQYTSPYSRPPTPTRTLLPPSPTEHAPQPDYTPLNVMEALMEEDMVRLRSRRRSGVHGRRHAPDLGGLGSDLSSPCGSTFSTDSGSVPLGCGTGNGLRDVLPLKSSFFDWCCEYFKEPQMRQAEADEPGSVQYNYQVWRQQRNEEIITEVHSQTIQAERAQWDRPVANLQVNGNPLSMALHAYDPHLVVANDTDTISVWDWSQRKRLNFFYNGNPRGTSITSLHIINQDVGGIIMTGSADGIVRLYRNYDPALDQGPLQMVSSFRALDEMISLRRGSGIIMDWKQLGGSLLVGGDSRIIRIWDAHTELHVLNLETHSESPVTAIASDNSSASTFMAAFVDGVIKMFDWRLEEEDAIVRTYQSHLSWVQNVKYRPRYSGQFLSASVAGDVRLWDVRGSERPIHTLDLHPGGLSTFDVHPQTAVFSTTSALTPANWRHQRLLLHSMADLNVLSSITLPTGLPVYSPRPSSPYIPRHSSFVFHPLDSMYAVGEPDGSVKLMGCKPS
ncbi:raptor N-terminal caspase like domain-containing protein [Pisolithus marmoratus]|nr:raptor N-terminal caspase like domain-containing protein [Pisolithus marmoratus]